ALPLHAFSGEPERLTTLCLRWDLRAHRSVNRRHFDLRPFDRFTDRDRQLDVDVVSAALEVRMRTNANEQLEIARRATSPARFALAPNQQSLAVGDSFRDLDFDGS